MAIAKSFASNWDCFDQRRTLRMAKNSLSIPVGSNTLEVPEILDEPPPFLLQSNTAVKPLGLVGMCWPASGSIRLQW